MTSSFPIGRRLGAVTLFLCAAQFAQAPTPAKAQALEPLSVIVFPGGFNWPIWVAQEKGLFAQGAASS